MVPSALLTWLNATSFGRALQQLVELVLAQLAALVDVDVLDRARRWRRRGSATGTMFEWWSRIVSTIRSPCLMFLRPHE